MRVLYSFPDVLGKPGIGVTAIRQVRALVELGAEVSVICGSVPEPPEGLHHLVETLSVRGKRIPHRLLGRANAYRYHDWRAARHISASAGQLEVAHLWPRAVMATAAAAHARGMPCVREAPNAHTRFAMNVVNAEHAKLGLALPSGYSHTEEGGRLRLEEEEFAAVEAILAPSEFVVRTFESAGIPRRRILTHQYGADLIDGASATSPPNGAEQPLSLCFVGSGEPRKGLHAALDAWLASGAAETGRFRIVGELMHGYVDVLGRRLDHPSVELVGFLKKPTAVMAESHALVLASVEEGSALVTYEAQAAGCALLVSDATGALCTDGVEGLIHPPGDVTALATQIARLNDDRALLERLRRAALEHSHRLTWLEAGRRLLACYEEIALGAT